MRRRSRRSGRRADLGSAGWLFADLLLVLSVVAFGGTAIADDVPLVGLASAPQKKTLPTAAPTKARPAGVELKPYQITIPVNTRRLIARDAGELSRLRAQLAAKTAPLKGRRAALVLTFGCDRDLGVGEAMAIAANSQLAATNKALFTGAVTRDFIRTKYSNQLMIEIYLFTA